MKERSITKPQVLKTAASADSEYTNETGTKTLNKNFGGKTLEVVIEPKKNKIIVITAYWL